MERRARRSAEKLDPDCRLRAICSRDAGAAEVELIGFVAGKNVVARARADTMYEAADAAFEKLAAQARRAHDRNAGRRASRRRGAPRASAERPGAPRASA